MKNQYWPCTMTERDFVDSFNPEELDLINAACDTFKQWQNLVSYNCDEHLTIGRAMSISYLFNNPTESEIKPYDYTSSLMCLINDYKYIVADTYQDFKDSDEDEELASIFYNRLQCCKDLLGQLAQL